MIRPSPTSISLSSQDISLHLQHADIYYGLLKQGFKKKEIHRYFRAQRAAAIQDASAHKSVEPLLAPSNVELASKSSNREYKSKAQTPSADSADIDHSAGKETGSVDFEASVHSKEVARLPQCERPPPSSTSINVDRIPPMRAQRNTSVASTHSLHAPRRTSLLRFSNNLSSDEPQETQSSAGMSHSPRLRLRYRPRTETCSYEQSEISIADSSCSSLDTVLGALTLDDSLVPPVTTTLSTSQLRGDAEEFTPFSAFSAHSTTTTMPSSLDYLLADMDISASSTSPEINSPIVPVLLTRRPEWLSLSTAAFQSSPPVLIEDSIFERGSQQHLSPTLPPIPSTPTPWRRADDTRTEPRENRFRYLDGPSFTPYNDSVPASMQPQTPADLARQPVVGETNAAYTAPPGRLRHDVVSGRLEHVLEIQPGEESPTNRAVSIRQRRNREYARSARIEGQRISRLRRSIQSGRNEAGETMHQPPDTWDIEDQFNLWRDDLDADRVGEENFDDATGFTDASEVGMRVVSGNRHVQGI